ncbi:MAG: hypothetical protein WAW16_04375, partial [Candidatus Cryosericum sp.]
SLIRDPDHVESSTGEASGLGLLHHVTTFRGTKKTYQVQAMVTSSSGWLSPLAGQSLQGYEIHMGSTEGDTPWLSLTRRGDPSESILDGDMSADCRIWGCYVHGIFSNGNLRRAWLVSLGWHEPVGGERAAGHARSLDRLADTVLCAINMEQLQRIIDEQ